MEKVKVSKVNRGHNSIYAPWHPRANSWGHVPRARWLVEQELGVLLPSHVKVVHSTSKTDDRFGTLIIRDTKNKKQAWATDLVHQYEGFRMAPYRTIAKLRREGLGYKQIAKATGSSRSTVKNAIKRMEREGTLNIY